MSSTAASPSPWPPVNLRDQAPPEPARKETLFRKGVARQLPARRRPARRSKPALFVFQLLVVTVRASAIASS